MGGLISCYDISERNVRAIGQTEIAVDYRALAEFRYQIRRFLRFSEGGARAAGLEPQQHQLLLAIRGLAPTVEPTVGELAKRLQIRHHSVVELVDRLEERRLAGRRRSGDDGRKVLVYLTSAGEAALRSLAVQHRAEMARAGPELLSSLRALLDH